MNSKAHSPELRIDFKQVQAGFTAYVKNPTTTSMPTGIKPERMAMYAELLFNNVESFLGSNFPVLKKITPASQWLQLVKDFYAQHRSKSPYFSDIPQEFLAYCQDERDSPNDYPFMLELAHYEWVEMALSIAQEELVINQNLEGLQEKMVQLSPLAWVLAYQYPVQQIAPEYLPETPPAEPTLLIVYRDQHDAVKFIAINPITYQLLQLIQAQPGKQTLEYLQQLMKELNMVNDQAIVTGGLKILTDLAERNVLNVFPRT